MMNGNLTITKKINLLIISVLTIFFLITFSITVFILNSKNSKEITNLKKVIISEKKNQIKQTAILLNKISLLSTDSDTLVKTLNTMEPVESVHIYLVNKVDRKIVFTNQNCNGQNFSCLGWNGFEMFQGSRGFVNYTYKGYEGHGYYINSNFPEYVFAVAQPVEKLEQILINRRNILNDNIRTQYIWLFVLSIFLLIMVIGVSTFLSRGISEKIKRASDHLRDIAEGEGDLTKRLEVSGDDEIGELSGWFNVFIENVQLVFKDVSANAVNIKRSSSDLFGVAGNLSKGVESTFHKSDKAASSSEKVSTRINAVAAAMKQASSNIANIAAAAEQMSSTISEVSSNTEVAHGISTKAVTQAKNASSNVLELNKAALEIDKVTENIAEISEQTNLLALNATIEAARAGVAGRGFAVVANEVKNLANQTVEATLEIRGKIYDIQQKTEGTINEIESISDIINQINDIVSSIAAAIEEQSVTTREIAENVAQTSGGIGEISGKVGTNSVVIREIADDIYDVHSTADDLAKGNKDVHKNADELNKMAEELRSLVDKFKV